VQLRGVESVTGCLGGRELHRDHGQRSPGGPALRPRKPASVGESVSNDMQEAGSLFGAVRFNALAGSAELAGKSLALLAMGLPPSWSAWLRCMLRGRWMMRSSARRRRALSEAEPPQDVKQPCAPSGTPVAGYEAATPVSAVSNVSDNHLDLRRPAAQGWSLTGAFVISRASGLHIGASPSSWPGGQQREGREHRHRRGSRCQV
jgi:hypothetical protein